MPSGVTTLQTIPHCIGNRRTVFPKAPLPGSLAHSTPYTIAELRRDRNLNRLRNRAALEKQVRSFQHQGLGESERPGGKDERRGMCPPGATHLSQGARWLRGSRSRFG